MGGCITNFLYLHSSFVKDIFDITNVSINNSNLRYNFHYNDFHSFVNLEGKCSKY
jgi:hypothetical protein